MKSPTISALIIAMLFALAGCSGGNETTQQSESSPERVGTGSNRRPYAGVELHILANDHPWVHHISQKVSAFTRATGATVHFEVYPEEQFRVKRTVEMLSGISEIDAYMIMPGNSLDEYYHQGWIEPLDDFMGTGFQTDDFYPRALAAGMREGQHFTIPLLLETSILAYNRRIFDEYGLTVPRTMEELERVAGEVYRRSNGTIYGITMRGRGASATSQWADFLHSFGGAWVDEDGMAALDSPEARAALEYYGRLLREYGPPDATGNGWYESLSLFMRGDAAMIFDANVFRTHYEDRERSLVAGEVGYATLPAGPAGTVPHISHWGLAIYPGSRNKEAMWLFIEWASTVEQALSAHLAGIPSARMSIWRAPEVTDVDPAPQWTDASTRSYEIATYQWNPPVRKVEEARAVVGSAIVDAILGQEVAPAARRATEGLNTIIRSEE